MAKKQKLSQACWAIRVMPKSREPFFKERNGTVELFATREEAREDIRDRTAPGVEWRAHVDRWTAVRVDVVKR